MNDSEQEIIERKVRRTVGLNALRKIGGIVAEEQQADEEKTKVIRWLTRYGWLILLGGALLLAYAIGFI